MGITSNPEKWNTAAAEAIRAERAARQMSQAQVASKSGIPRPTYIRYETGERVPNLAKLIAIAYAFDMSIDSFVKRVSDRLHD